MSDFYQSSLTSFSGQYLASASTMCQWLDAQLSTGSLGVHAALRALNQIVEDVSSRHLTITGVASEGIGVRHKLEEDEEFWRKEVSDIADKARLGMYDALYGTGDKVDDKRAIVAVSILKVTDDLHRLQTLQKSYEIKWTSGPTPSSGSKASSAGYHPSSLLFQSGKSIDIVIDKEVHLLGSSVKDVGGSSSTELGRDAEMWSNLKELSDTESSLLLKWHDVAVKVEREKSERMDYRPADAAAQAINGAPGKSFFARRHLPTYVPHPSEMRGFGKAKEGGRRPSVDTKAAAAAAAVKAPKIEKKDDNDDLENSDPALGAELQNLKRLAKFRQEKREALVSEGVTNCGTKYGAFKFSDENTDYGVQEDDDEEMKLKQLLGADPFAAEDDRARQKLIKDKAKMQHDDEMGTVGKFPFKLNRFTIDSRMQPARLWHGGSAACDIPPLVDGPECAYEVSTVALIVPTRFVGEKAGAHAAGGGAQAHEEGGQGGESDGRRREPVLGEGGNGVP